MWKFKKIQKKIRNFVIFEEFLINSCKNFDWNTFWTRSALLKIKLKFNLFLEIISIELRNLEIVSFLEEKPVKFIFRDIL